MREGAAVKKAHKGRSLVSMQAFVVVKIGLQAVLVWASLHVHCPHDCLLLTSGANFVKLAHVSTDMQACMRMMIASMTCFVAKQKLLG